MSDIERAKEIIRELLEIIEEELTYLDSDGIMRIGYKEMANLSLEVPQIAVSIREAEEFLRPKVKKEAK